MLRTSTIIDITQCNISAAVYITQTAYLLTNYVRIMVMFCIVINIHSYLNISSTYKI